MPQQNLVFLFGPPAVGKMTVGRALEAVTGIPLFHNHMSIELVLPFFGFESPSFNRLVSGFREQLFAEVAEHGQSGMIFTYVWAFDVPSDLEFAVRAKNVFESHGARVVFVELWADLDTRVARSATPLRLAEKPSQRDVAAARSRLAEFDRRYRLTTDGTFPLGDWLRIDNTALEPDAAAELIVTHFGLPHPSVRAIP